MPCVCDQHAKRGQQARDYENMPQWMADRLVYFGPFDEVRNVAMLEHRVYNNLRILNDIERIFGQQCDDEKLIELQKSNTKVRSYSREITLLMAQTIPTPLSVKDLYSVYTLGSLTKIDPEDTLNFWKLVRDEVKWRAENKIAAVGNERFRFIEAHPPAWHYMKYYRYMEQYGAVCLGSQYSHLMSQPQYNDGVIGFKEAYNYPADTPIKTREDAVRFGLGYEARRMDNYKMDEYLRPHTIVEFAQIMKADGALLPNWRAGIGCALTRKEQVMYLKEAGLSVIQYEGSQPGERTDMDEKRFLDQLDTWMESLGLRKLVD
jgi:benzoyl-CoA reductase subunit B